MDWILAHGPSLVFLFSFLNALKAPLPCSPVLIVAGGLAYKGLLNGPLLLLLATLGGVLGDLPWFLLGRLKGPRIMHIVCTFSLDRPSCVGTMEDLYRRRGPVILIVSRFIPGLAAVAPPMAGAAQLPLAQFLGLATLGSALYSLALLLSGILFGDWASDLVNKPPDPTWTLVIILSALIAFLIYKSWLRFREKLAPSVPRITVAQVRKLQRDGQEVIFVDTRPTTAWPYLTDMIAGAVTPEDLTPGTAAKIVTYCSCTLEASAAALASILRKQGYDAQPLKGGWDAWARQ